MGYNTNILNWLAAVSMAVMIVILIYINFSLAISVITYKKPTKNPANKLLMGLSMITILSYTLSAIFGFEFVMICLKTNNLNAKASSDSFIAYIMALLFYLLSPIFMIFVFTVRIDVTFRNSPIAYSKGITRSLYISSIVLFITFIGLMLFSSIKYGTHRYILAAIWIITQISLSMILCILFYKKIESLMMMRKMAKINEASVSTKSYKKENNANIDDTDNCIKQMIDNEFLFIVIKHGLLVPITILSSFLCFILAVIISMTQKPYSFHAFGTFLSILDCTISSMSIYLLFSFNDNVYNKLCYPLHSLCTKYKLSQIAKKMDNKHKETQNEHDNVQKIEIEQKEEHEEVKEENTKQPQQQEQNGDGHFVLKTNDGIQFDLKNKNSMKMLAILH